MTVYCPLTMTNHEGPLVCVEYMGDACNHCPAESLYDLPRAINALTHILNADGYSPADVIADSIGNVSESLDGLADAVGDLKKVDASPKGASRRSRR